MHTDYFVEVLIAFLVFFLLYILIIPIAEGGLIALIDKVDTTNHSGEVAIRNQTVGYGLSRGIRHFLPVFEANGITALFKLVSIITFTFFLIRLLGKEYTGQILIFMGFYFLVALVINILLAYTRFFIVLKGMKAFDAVVASAGMALENIGITMRLYTTLLVVYVRTLLTVLLLIAFPFVLSGILTYITTAFLQIIFIGLLGVLGLGFLIFVSHLSSVLEIFVETLWYRAYIDNLKHSGSSHENPTDHPVAHY